VVRFVVEREAPFLSQRDFSPEKADLWDQHYLSKSGEGSLIVTLGSVKGSLTRAHLLRAR
jgi:hypothetical protein